ncbi:MAG: 4'-phosphopantetheinyl transferase family protein [Bryobacteraceae bacterium]
MFEAADFEFDLSVRIVHVWRIDISASNAVAERLLPLLARDERDRAAGFRFDGHRNSFIAAHGALRILLGRYLNDDASNIQLTYGSKGKPSLAGPSRIRFNASHSGRLALVALTLDCDIGVDVEQIRPFPNVHEVINRFFSAEEAAELSSLPADEHASAFFRCWTRKEAYIKAIGDGLSAPLNDFRVTMQPGEPARLIHVAHDPAAASAWNLHDLQVASSYAAALAYRDLPRLIHVTPLVEPAELLELA